MSSLLYNFILIAVFILSIAVSANGDPATQSRINHICHFSYDYNLCRQIYTKHLITKVADFKALTKIAITQTLLFTTDTIKVIRESERSAKSQTLRDLIKICDEGYGILLNQFVEANFAFEKGDYKSMLFDMEKCERFVNDCENAVGSQVPALHSKNVVGKVLVKMSNVSGGLIGQPV